MFFLFIFILYISIFYYFQYRKELILYYQNSIINLLQTGGLFTFYEIKRIIDNKMLIGKTSNEKNNMLIQAWYDCKQYEKSLLIINDIETLIDFACIHNTINFSNLTYQTLQAILKTISNESNTSIVVIANDINLAESVHRMLGSESDIVGDLL